MTVTGSTSAALEPLHLFGGESLIEPVELVSNRVYEVWIEARNPEATQFPREHGELIGLITAGNSPVSQRAPRGRTQEERVEAKRRKAEARKRKAEVRAPKKG